MTSIATTDTNEVNEHPAAPVVNAATATASERRLASAPTEDVPAAGPDGAPTARVIVADEEGDAPAAVYPVIADRYRVKGILGAGGMGVVYLAERIDDGVTVALKLMRKEFASDPTLGARLQREAKAVRRIRH